VLPITGSSGNEGAEGEVLVCEGSETKEMTYLSVENRRRISTYILCHHRWRRKDAWIFRVRMSSII
jgi:hypothetical protein